MPHPTLPSPDDHPLGQLASDPARLADILLQADEGFGLVDADEVFLAANPAADAIFGVPSGALRGRCLMDFLEPDQQARVRQETEARQRGAPNAYEVQIRRADGALRTLWVTVIADRSAGTYRGAAGFFRDITPRLQAEQALKRSEARFRNLVDQAPVAIAMTRQTRFVHVNRAWLDLFGFANTQALAEQTIFQRVHPEDLEAFRVRPSDLAEGKATPGPFIFRALRADGGAFLASAEVTRVDLDDGPATLGFFHDITLARQAEAEREQLILDLQGALEEVRVLSGLLPICSYCHKIRDDGGYWNRLEAYLEVHTGAAFSHGVCPDCLKVHFPDLP